MPAVLTERRDAVLVITIDRPEARNAVNRAVAEGIAAALDELDGDDALAVGVLTGAGGGFCAGMDLKAFVAGESPHVEGRGFAGHRPARRRASRSSPRSRASRWPAASRSPWPATSSSPPAAPSLGIPEVKRSLVAAGGALRRLPAPHALRRGDGARADGGPDRRRARPRPRASSTAWPSRAARSTPRSSWPRRSRSNGPLAVAATKAGPRAPVGVGRGGVLDPPARDHRARLRLRGRREGAVAFAEKREPVWQGR